MSSFRVNLEQLDLLIERMSAVEAELAGVHDDVESRMQRLQVVWSGRAAAEHQVAFQRWSSGAVQAREALAQLRRIARLAHGNYSGAVTANQAMWAT